MLSGEPPSSVVTSTVSEVAPGLIEAISTDGGPVGRTATRGELDGLTPAPLSATTPT